MQQITFPFDKHHDHVCQFRFTMPSFANDGLASILTLNNRSTFTEISLNLCPIPRRKLEISTKTMCSNNTSNVIEGIVSIKNKLEVFCYEV